MDQETFARLVRERDDLKEKAEKLRDFILTEFDENSRFASLDYIERSELRLQSRYMNNYLEVLNRRIQRQKSKVSQNA